MASLPDPTTNSEFQTNQNDFFFIFHWLLKNKTIIKTARVIRFGEYSLIKV